MTPDATRIMLGTVDPALKILDLWSQSAENLVLGTAAHESGGFKFRHQVGGGPALGLWQIEPATFDDLVEHVKITNLPRMLILDRLAAPGGVTHDQLETNDALSAAVCRLLYARHPDPLPANADDVASLAALWKKLYNTPLGGGTEAQFTADYHRYVTGLE